ncbi:hypothetical protein [Desulfovibrio sp. JC010]|uniref:hypothetical protein n=1 Tax=Desulfovibrio sp. JC010 TaxID=2593641 RepID=UPI0013D1197C|nr:hypothetical protein [Desulfovibrio sp. JC010]NDV27514.1 hypothetical protein [Desulfovibrio sp. JC010]
MKEDGGYIAIRGFAYQFDKALLDMIQNPDRVYQIEHLQDHNYEDCAIQVKYYGREYTASEQKQKIKNIIIKLLTDFSENSELGYCIYAYFAGSGEKTILFDIDMLNSYLGKEQGKFDAAIKGKFVEKFKLIYAPDFKKQFEILITEISRSYNCDENDACCYHAMMVSHLERLVLKYKLEQAGERVCSKDELDKLVATAKDVIFRTAYVEFLGKDKFQKHIHKQYFKRQHIDAKERIFIIEPPVEWESHLLRHVLYDIAMKWGKHSDRIPNTERCSPFFFLRIKENQLIELKEKIRAAGKSFKDGHYFKGASFDPKLLVEIQSKTDRFDMFFIHSVDEIFQTFEVANRPKEIFQFFCSTPIKIDADVKHVKIQIQDLGDIGKMI